MTEAEAVQYPINAGSLNKECWNKRVSATLMSSFLAEDDTIPILHIWVPFFERLKGSPLEETLDGEQVIEFFFNNCLSQVCHKLICSKYFKNDQVLVLSNRILELGVEIYLKYLHLTPKYPKFAELLMHVFNNDAQYFKTNNQLDNKAYPWLYYQQPVDHRQFLATLKPGDMLDAVKYDLSTKKATWSRAILRQIDEEGILTVAYLNDCRNSLKDFHDESVQIAPLGTMSKDFEWRMSLKEGDVIDCSQTYGSWYTATVAKVKEYENGCKRIRVTFKVYDPAGDRINEKGCYFGLSDSYDEDDIDVTSPRVQQVNTIAKYREYLVSRSTTDYLNDTNDHVFETVSGERITFIPRGKCCSGFLLRVCRNFIKEGGFDRMFAMLEAGNNPELLNCFLSAVGNLSSNLHRGYVTELINRLKTIVYKHLVDESEASIKGLTKDKCEQIFCNLKMLVRRVQSSDSYKEYEIGLKLELAHLCLRSQALKRRLQGLSELKDILRSIRSAGISKLAKLADWLKQNRVFQKIYIEDRHVQLIKKSTEFFRFLVSQEILQVDQLRQVYTVAQKGDYETRISIYRLLEQVTNSFKKQHVDFLIDQILESEANLVACQDLELLHELSRYSNYFPLKQVTKFFLGLILTPNLQPQLLEVSIKKYVDMIVKNYEMAPYRKEILLMFVEKLNTDQVIVSLRVLCCIFESLGMAEYVKNDLLDYLNEKSIGSIILNIIQSNKQKPEYLVVLQKLLNFLQILLTTGQRVKLDVQVFIRYWRLLNIESTNEKERQLFIKWCAAISKLDYGFLSGSTEELEGFFLKLVNDKHIVQMTQPEFEIVRSLMIDINNRHGLISISSIWRYDKDEKVTRVTVDFNKIKFYNNLKDVIYRVADEKVGELATDFYNTLYASQQINASIRKQCLDETFEDFFRLLKDNKIGLAIRSLKIIDFIIDESEKDCNSHIKSLATIRKGETLLLDIVNTAYHSFDSPSSNKNFNIKTTSNSTLFEVRSVIATHLSMTWQELKMTQRDELPDILNSRLIKELNLKLNDPIKVSKRFTNQVNEQLIIGNKLNPKAVKVFTNIFAKFSTNGLMSKTECNNFIVACLGESFSKNDDKITTVYEKYDTDRDEYLTIQNFLAFYEDSSRQRPSTVWSNLKSFKIRYDFRSFDDAEVETVDVSELPRTYIGQRPDFYEALFGLLDEEEQVANKTWKMFERLEISSVLYNEILGGSKENMMKLLSLESPYKMLYCLYLFEYLLETHSDELKADQMQWKEQFDRDGGYEKLFEIYTELQKKETKLKPIEEDIKQFILKMVTPYIIRSFNANLEAAKACAYLSSQLDYKELLQLMSVREIPREVREEAKIKQFKKTLEVEAIQPAEHPWRGCPRNQLIQMMLNTVNKLWTQTTNIIQRDSQLLNCFRILLGLLIDQDTAVLCDVVAGLLVSCQSVLLLRQLYIFICALCVHSKANQQPLVDCLAKFLQLNRTDLFNEQYFKAISLLFSKFGLKQGVQEVSVLLTSNILRSSNELIVEGCASLLSYIPSAEVSVNTIEELWRICLFGDNNNCKTESSRHAIYNLLLSVARRNHDVSKRLIEITLETLNRSQGKLKVLSQNEMKNRSPYNYAGIKNLGAICYMLSVIQQFYLNKTFRNLLLRIDDGQAANLVENEKDGRRIDDNLLHQLQRLFAFLGSTQRLDYNPQDFCFAWKGVDGQPVNVLIQQDAQEFTSMILDRLEEGIKKTPFKKIIDCIYTGRVANLLTCELCQKAKQREENFYCLSLEVKNYKMLSESLGKLIQGETINDYQCDFCNRKADVVKRTVISKCPNTLILHLQRNVFNLDTFVNEKISNRFEFPLALNIKPYTLDTIMPQANNVKGDAEYEYELVGVVAHNGSAEYGHYYSYIRTDNGQWLQFNDSNIYSFDMKKMEAECFGGTTQVIEDEFELTKRQNSKNAYMLIYDKKLKSNIELVFANEQEKTETLSRLNLKEFVEVIEKPIQDNKEVDETNDKTEEKMEDKVEKETEEMEKDDKEQPKENEQPITQPTEIIIKLSEPILSYSVAGLDKTIDDDNKFHEYEVNICSGSFIQFFGNLLELDIDKKTYAELVEITQTLAFGVWIKQPKLKDLLMTLQLSLIKQPEVGLVLLRNNAIVNALLESNDAQLRNSINSLLSGIVRYNVSHHELPLTKKNEIDEQIIEFLDMMFSLIPTKVSKNWIKFTQYFDFWKDFATQGKAQFDYLIRKECISHFYDYFLDKKSPLGIYANKQHSIGNKYVNPNFAPLLETANYLLMQLCTNDPSRLSLNDTKIMSIEFFYKMMSEQNHKLVCMLIPTLCHENLKISVKVAFVLIRGIYTTNFDTIQPYLDVTHCFLTVNDSHKQLRMKWILGVATLNLSPFKTLQVYRESTTEEKEDRLYIYDSTLHMEQYHMSVLESLYKNHDKIQIFCILMLKGLITLCLDDDQVLHYVRKMPAPSFRYSRYIDFFKIFIKRFNDDAARAMSHSSYPKAEVGKTVSQLYERFVAKVLEAEESEFEQVKEQQEPRLLDQLEIPLESTENTTVSQDIKIEEGSNVPTNNDEDEEAMLLKLTSPKDDDDESSDTLIIDSVAPKKELTLKQTYHPCRFIYNPVRTQYVKALTITYHESTVVYVKTQPSGYVDDKLKSTIRQVADNLLKEGWTGDKTETVQGIVLTNNSRDTYIIKWRDGCSIVKSDTVYVWADDIKVLKHQDKTMDDWPKWNLYE